MFFQLHVHVRNTNSILPLLRSQITQLGLQISRHVDQLSIRVTLRSNKQLSIATLHHTSSRLYCLLESHSFGQLCRTLGHSFSMWCYKEKMIKLKTLQWSIHTCSCWAGTSFPQCWQGCGLIGHSTSWWVVRIRYWIYWPHCVHWISLYSHTGRWACVFGYKEWTSHVKCWHLSPLCAECGHRNTMVNTMYCKLHKCTP